MEQKNTIVKCTANPNCLFNHNGVCDNYVITIGADGSCQEYVETEDVTIRPVLCEHCGHYEDHGLLQNPCNKHECYRHRKEKACVDFIAIRGLRAKGNLLEDTVIDEQLHEHFKVFLNNWIKEHPPLSKEDQAIMNDIGYVPPKEEDQMCWYCDHGKHGKCKFSIRPMKDANGECCRFVSTGGNR